MAGGGEKTEKASPKRRRDERKKGNVLMSRDVVAVVTLFGSYAVLRFGLPMIARTLSTFVQYILTLIETVTTGAMTGVWPELQIKLLQAGLKAGILPLLVTVLGATIATFAQTRLLVTFESLKPQFNRLNPLSGIKRLFSLKSIIEALKGVLKVTILLVLIYNFVASSMLLFTQYLSNDLLSVLSSMQTLAFDLMLKVGVAFAILAAFDFLYQWWDYERQIKMSKEELKEEYKQTEGDPKIKGKIKENQRRMAQQRMMQQVPKADVVVRNPTHFAVALRYRPGQDEAPMVLAKGQDELALRIVAMAEQNGVAVVENRPLARALYAECEIGSAIPAEQYAVVADILVYIYKINKNIVPNP